jgi:hypothetical protein
VNCTHQSHERTKRTTLEFLWHNDFVGLQRDGTELLVLANCPRCRSTLARSVEDEK